MFHYQQCSQLNDVFFYVRQSGSFHDHEDLQDFRNRLVLSSTPGNTLISKCEKPKVSYYNALISRSPRHDLVNLPPQLIAG